MMNTTEDKKKSQTISFRLDIDLLEEIKKEADLEGMNVNALVSKILSNHMLWEKYERKVGLLPMTKPFVKYCLDKMDEKEIIHLAEAVEEDTFSDILNFMKGKYSVRDFVDFIRTWLYVAWMQHDIVQDDKSYTFKIKHDLNAKWSLYLQTVVTKLFHDVIKKRLEVKTTKNTIVFIFPIS